MNLKHLIPLVLAFPLVCACSYYRISGEVDRRSPPSIYPVSFMSKKPYIRAKILDTSEKRYLLIESYYRCEAEQAYNVEHFRKEGEEDPKLVSVRLDRWASQPLACSPTLSPNRRVRVYSKSTRFDGVSNSAGVVLLDPNLGKGPYRVDVDDYFVGELTEPTTK